MNVVGIRDFQAKPYLLKESQPWVFVRPVELILHKVNLIMVDAVFLKRLVVSLAELSKFGLSHIGHFYSYVALNFIDLKSAALMLLRVHNVAARILE